MIGTHEVAAVVGTGEIIEDYPTDPRGHGSLMLGHGDGGRPIHDQVVERVSRAEASVKCLHCQGEMKRGSAPVHIDRAGCHVVLDSVPAWVCEQCGEPYFDEREADAIQHLVREVEDGIRRIAGSR